MHFSGWTPFPIDAEMRDAELARKAEQANWRTGPHIGAAIQLMKLDAGEEIEGDPTEQPGVRLQEGFLWETVLEFRWKGVPLDQAFDLAWKRLMVAVRGELTTQVKLERDGWRGTPDGVGEGFIESYKCTRRSFAKAETQGGFENYFWTWLVQEKAYCLMAGVDTARWIVLWQCGDYGKGLGTGPTCMQLECVFTPAELAENWRQIALYKKDLDRTVA
jgi:hypothetical protein